MTQLEHESAVQGEAIQLPAELTIARSSEFYQRFAELIEQGSDVILDGAAVTRIDTAFIQLLCQLQRELAETSHCLQWRETSEVINHSVKLLGMNEHLNLVETN